MLRTAILVTVGMALLSGCGLKGNLYLPDKTTTPVVTSNSVQSSSSSSNSTTP